MIDTLRKEEKASQSSSAPGTPWKVAVLANIKEHGKPLPEGVPPDAGADFDYIETIDQIRAAIETDGHKTLFIQADARPALCTEGTSNPISASTSPKDWEAMAAKRKSRPCWNCSKSPTPVHA